MVPRKQMVMNLNPYVALSAEHSLRGNKVIPIMKGMVEELAREPKEIFWGDGKDRQITKPGVHTIGDFFVSGGSRVPRFIREAGIFFERAFTPNYSDSNGYVATREAIRLQIKNETGVDIPIGRIFVGEGITWEMQPIGKIFSREGSKFVAGAIGYPPSFGSMISNQVMPKFVRVDKRHWPIIGDSDLADRDVQFIQTYLVGNPGGMTNIEERYSELGNKIRFAITSNGQPMFLVVDDPYRIFLKKEERVNCLGLAEKLGIPMMYQSGIDKPLGTGNHIGWTAIYVPPDMEDLGRQIDQYMGWVHAQYLGTNSNGQFKTMLYNLVLAGFKPDEIYDWLRNLPQDFVRNGSEKQYQRRLEALKRCGFFERALTMEEDIAKNVERSWKNTEVMLEVIDKNNDVIALHGEPPNVPFYLFCRLKESAWENAQAFAVDLAENTGIGVTPGDFFIAKEFREENGLCFRYSVNRNPALPDLENPDSIVNSAVTTVKFIRHRLLEKSTNSISSYISQLPGC